MYKLFLDSSPFFATHFLLLWRSYFLLSKPICASNFFPWVLLFWFVVLGNLHLFVAIFFFGVMCADKLIWRVIISLLLQQISEFDLFTLDDIDSAFQVMTRLTYSQNHHLTGTHFQWWSMFTFWGLYMYIHSLLFFRVKWFGWKKIGIYGLRCQFSAVCSTKLLMYMW